MCSFEVQLYQVAQDLSSARGNVCTSVTHASANAKRQVSPQFIVIYFKLNLAVLSLLYTIYNFMKINYNTFMHKFRRFVVFLLRQRRPIYCIDKNYKYTFYVTYIYCYQLLYEYRTVFILF